MNFLKVSTYLSVGRWQMCDCISVMSEDEIWKHFCAKKDLSLLHPSLSTIQSAQACSLLCFSMTHLSANISVSHDTQEVIFWEAGFLFIAWHSVEVPAYVNNVLGSGASQTPPLSALLAASVSLFRPARKGSVLRSPAQHRARREHTSMK